MLELIKRDRVACEVENWRTGSALDWKGVNRQQALRTAATSPYSDDARRPRLMALVCNKLSESLWTSREKSKAEPGARWLRPHKPN